MRMQAQDEAVAVAHIAGKPFDLVGIDIGRRHLDRGRQVDDHLFIRRRPPDIHDRLADLDREIELGAAEALGRILIDDLGLRHLGRELADLPRARHRDVDDARPVEPEDDAALQFRGRVVEMHDRALGAADRLEGLVDQLGARLGQHLDRHVLGDQVLLDDLAHEVEIGLRGRRETDLDLLEAELQQHVEHAPLALGAHRLDQRLVAVAQIDRAPGRRLGDRAGRPLPVGQLDGRERPVFVNGHGSHKKLLGSERAPRGRAQGGVGRGGPAAYPVRPALSRAPSLAKARPRALPREIDTIGSIGNHQNA